MKSEIKMETIEPDLMTNDELLDSDQDENSRSTESDLEHDLPMHFSSSNARRSTRKRVNYKVNLDIFHSISMQTD